MEQMNSKLSVKYQYKDARKIMQQKEISISSGYTDGFNLYQITDFLLNVINLTEHSMDSVLLALVESYDYTNGIVDELINLGYGSKEKGKK